MSLRITKQGLSDTIQDFGRKGYQHLGINPGGAMDLVAMRIANALVGNDPKEAVIEMHFPATEILFEQTVLVAMAGADFSATINEESIPVLHPVMIRKGSVLKFQKKQKGARLYLAVQGGYLCDEWLGSCSTNTKVKAGGYYGRALQKGDLLHLKQEPAYRFIQADHYFEIFPWQANDSEFYREGKIRFITAPEYDLLDGHSKTKMENMLFTITPSSDRMGYRLSGDPLKMAEPVDMISTAAIRGTIQLLPDKQLIILMADHQTSGGYPRLGYLISADIPAMAQKWIGQQFSLERITLADAETIVYNQEMNLQLLQNACNFRLQQYLAND
jgi:antagonist of KipI